MIITSLLPDSSPSLSSLIGSILAPTSSTLLATLLYLLPRSPSLFSAPPPSPPIPSPIPSPDPQSNCRRRNESFAYHGPRPPTTPRAFSPSPYSHSSGVGRVTEDAAEVFKRNAVGKLVETMHGDATAMRKARETEMEGWLCDQGVLKRREEELGRGVMEMMNEKEGLEQMLQVVLMNCDVLDGWLRDNKAKAASKRGSSAEGDMEADEAFECVDALSKHMLECAALDLAIEDVIYSLDKATQEGAVPFDQYLKSVRMLSCKRFFYCATGIKVKAVQMRSQVANMAARVQHYVSLA